MKRPHTIPLIIFTVFFALAFAWILFYIGIYFPGRVVAEVIYADKDEFYGQGFPARYYINDVNMISEPGSSLIGEEKNGEKNIFLAGYCFHVLCSYRM